MKTIAFCSHGYTKINKARLLLVTAQMLLSAGKKIFLLDMNLEAPTLSCLASSILGEMTYDKSATLEPGGLLDILLHYQAIGQNPYLKQFVRSTANQTTFILPAGKDLSNIYLKKLSALDYKYFYPVNGPALNLYSLLNIVNRIDAGDELGFKPDYLLIDSAPKLSNFGIADCMFIADAFIWANGGFQFILDFLKEKDRQVFIARNCGVTTYQKIDVFLQNLPEISDRNSWYH